MSVLSAATAGIGKRENDTVRIGLSTQMALNKQALLLQILNCFCSHPFFRRQVAT